MIIKCCFCNYRKEATLNEDMLAILSEEDLPTEDFLLWMKRIFRANIFNVLNGVKIHMGRAHKDQTYFGIMPDFELSPNDNNILSKAIKVTK